MASILYKILFFYFFYFIDIKLRYITSIRYKNFGKRITNKMARNWVSFFHAFTAVITSFNYYCNQNSLNYWLMENFSSGYFIFDFLYIINYDKISMISYAYLYHHLASIYILINGRDYDVYRILLFAELSNLPSYFVYHNIKIKDDIKILFWKRIQKIFYVIIRLPVLGYLTYDISNNVEDQTPIYICFPVYIMGIIWSIILFTS